jgi:hypothetical protein
MNMKLQDGELSFNVLNTGSGEPALLFLHYLGGSSPMSIFMVAARQCVASCLLI